MEWTPFSFNGVHLHVPAGWDLRRFRGHHDAGEFVLQNETQVALDVRWARAEKIDSLDQVEASVFRRTAKPDGRRVDLDARHRLFAGKTATGRRWVSLILQPLRERYLVLDSQYTKGNAASFMKRLAAPALAPPPAGAEPWRFFSTRFHLPKDYRLREAEMKAGCIRMEFAHDFRELTLWDLSLLDQVLRQGDVIELAERLMKDRFARRFAIRHGSIQRGRVAGAFRAPVRRRLWMRTLASLFAGACRESLQGIPNPGRNRYALLFLQHRSLRDLTDLDSLAHSLCLPESAW